MKDKSLSYNEFVNEGILQKIGDRQMKQSIKRYAKLAHDASLLMEDVLPMAKIEKDKFAKKILFTSIKHINFFKQIHKELAKTSKNFLDLKLKTAIDTNNYLIAIKTLKDRRAKSYEIYVRDIAEFRKDSLKGDHIVKDVLKLYNKIKINI